MTDWGDQRTTLRIAISYAREDEAYARGIAGHLEQLGQSGLASVWIDRHIEDGAPWEDAIRENIEGADVVLMLISRHYLVSEFINERELDMIETARDQGAKLYPILVGKCLWSGHKRIARMQLYRGGLLFERPETRTFDDQAAELVEDIAAHLHERLLATAPDGEGFAPSPPPSAPEPAGDCYTGKGSRYWTQIYVNRATERLNDAVAAALPVDVTPEAIEWRSPLEDDNCREHRDDRFLEALGLEDHSDAHKRFWPRPGPMWDALGVLGDGSGDGRAVLLCEAKAYPAEMHSACKAKAPKSISMIDKAIRRMQSRGGLPDRRDRWLGRYYQLANRLAHAFWLHDHGVPTWLLLFMVVDDYTHKPTSRRTWDDTIGALEAELGLGPLLGGPIVPVFLQANDA